MNILTSTLFILSLSFNLYSMEPQLQLSSSPSNKGMLSAITRLFTNTVTNTTDNLWGHGDGYIDELEGKQESFRAYDMNLTDLLQLTHRGEWGMLEFLKTQDKSKIEQCLKLTDKHTVPLNPAVITAAKKLLETESPGPIFIRQFKDKKVALPDAVEVSSEELLHTIHLAENAVTQFIQTSNTEQLNEVLQLIQKHAIGINPIIKLNALSFFNQYQIKCQETILAHIANIKRVQGFKETMDDAQLTQSKIFNQEDFKEQLKQAVNPK